MRDRPSWVKATMAASDTWKREQAAAWSFAMRAPPGFVDECLRGARRRYRVAILEAFWRWVAPIGIGDCVPNEVATLLAEEWDERTKATPDQVADA